MQGVMLGPVNTLCLSYSPPRSPLGDRTCGLGVPLPAGKVAPVLQNRLQPDDTHLGQSLAPSLSSHHCHNPGQATAL